MPPASETWTFQAAALLVVAAVGAVGILLLFAAVRRLERKLAALDRLPNLEAALAKLAERESMLDLRRTEHTLIDIRDGLKRLEERLLAVAETRMRDAQTLPAIQGGPGSGGFVSDRILARLLALGYERIQVVTPADEMAAWTDGDGWAIVEARRDGALCKGRVRVARGLVGAVELQPAYSAFP
jgi:hypothetical protein